MVRAPGSAGLLPRALAALGLVLLTGCQVKLDVDLTARPDGGGEVRAKLVLDKDATAAVPDLAQDLRLDDLEAAGWSIEGPSRQEDGETRVEASKSFTTPAGADRAVEELSGPKGPFGDLRLRVDRSFLETRTSVEGAVDLSTGVEGFSDDVLKQRLGSPLGVDVATVERQLGKPLEEMLEVTVRARLPGEAPTVMSPKLGQRMELTATARRWNIERIAMAAVSVVSGVALVVVLTRRLLSAR
ncbi:MAG: hypothetical protein M3378_12720 [Actinomycetota bacterium]|nr:hypothetical protein [Actinomycetota bacterium]